MPQHPVTPAAELDDASYAVLAKAARALEESWQAAQTRSSSLLSPERAIPCGREC